MTIPYASATSGEKARAEIVKILRGFGCQSVGFMDEFETHTLILAFRHRGRPVQLRASAQGWANALLRWQDENRGKIKQRRKTPEEALDQGMVAVNSMLRDWIKGQITAIETGILTFEHVFLPYMLAADGRPLVEHIEEHKLLAPPEEDAA